MDNFRNFYRKGTPISTALAILALIGALLFFYSASRIGDLGGLWPAVLGMFCILLSLSSSLANVILSFVALNRGAFQSSTDKRFGRIILWMNFSILILPFIFLLCYLLISLG